MPKVAHDQILHDQIRVLVSACDGKVAAAARELGLPTLLIWRFHKSGKAIPRNERLIRVAMEKAALGSWKDGVAQARDKTKSENKLVEEFHISQSDIARLKRMLHHLLLVLDAREGSGSDVA